MNEKFSDEELNECLALAQTIGHLLHNKDFEVCMTALCLILAEGGIQKRDKLTKRQFVANIVETVGSCYEFALKMEESDG